RYCGDTWRLWFPPLILLPRVLVEGELEYVVEKILDSRISRRKLQYLVKWKGYGQEDNSWVFASDVHAADLVRAFHLARPDRPGGSGEGSVTPPQGGVLFVNSVIELPPVVMNGTSASSVHGLPLVAVSGAAASEVPSTAGYHDFALLAGSSGMQSGPPHRGGGTSNMDLDLRMKIIHETSYNKLVPKVTQQEVRRRRLLRSGNVKEKIGEEDLVLFLENKQLHQQERKDKTQEPPGNSETSRKREDDTTSGTNRCKHRAPQTDRAELL
ncbi:unnamed protein product, partial [Ranitomeya imitator]